MPAGAQPGPENFPAWLARRRREMDTGQDLHWCISDPASDVMVGNVQIFRMGPVEGRFQGELGYWLTPGARGRRILGEALTPVIAHAFAPVENGGLGLLRLHAGTDSDNVASQSVLRSVGFDQWGADHQAWRRSDGSLSDGAYFELLADTHRAAAAAGTTARIPARLDGTPVDQLHFAVLPGDPEPAPGTAGRTRGSTARGVEPVTLEAHGVRLRRWRHTDADRIVQACSDPRTQHWLGSLPSPYTEDDAHGYILARSEEAKEGKGLYWCVADPDSDVCLGSVAVMDLHDGLGTVGEVGYWAHPDARGRGVMSEAVRLAVRHAFVPREDGGLGRQRLRLNAAEGNSASAHLALANGFRQVGRDRRAEPLGDGTFADLLRFDLLVDEWNATG